MQVGIILLSALTIGFASPQAQTEYETLQCEAPNGGGLQSALSEFASLVPAEEVLMIVLTAFTTDNQVQNVVLYTQSDKFLAFVKDIQKSTEFITLVRFVCDKLYLDAIYYINIIGGFLGLPPVERPVIRDENRARPGLHGTLLDIFDVIEWKKVKALFKDKMINDEFFKLAVEALRSDENLEILSNLFERSDVQIIFKDIIDMGVDVEAIVSDIRKIVNDLDIQ